MNKKVLAGIAVLALVCGFAVWQAWADGDVQKVETVSQAKAQEEEDACAYLCPKDEAAIKKLRQEGYPESPIHPGVFGTLGEVQADYFFPRTLGILADPLFKDINRKIHAAVQKGDFKIEDFEKLDFSFPNEKTYGDNPQFEIFNPNGPFKAKTYGGKIVKDQDWKEVTEPDSKIMFVLVRQELGDLPAERREDMAVRETIYGVITNIKPEVCKSYYMVDKPRWKTSERLNTILKPISAGYVNDVWFNKYMVDKPACVEDADGKWFYFGRIITREQAKGETKWRM